MKLTLEEKEKLLKKAKDMYNEIILIKIRRDIKLTNIYKNYYPYDKYNEWGFGYYASGRVLLFGKDIKETIESLENYINAKKQGDERAYMYKNEVDILLDLIYNKNTILNGIKQTNEEERQTLNDLLN